MKVEETHLYREIHEQPVVLGQLLEKERPAIQRLADAVRRRQIDYVLIAARGTSDNAGRYAQYLLGAANRMVVALATPSLFSIYNQPPRLGNALVLASARAARARISWLCWPKPAARVRSRLLSPIRPPQIWLRKRSMSSSCMPGRSSPSPPRKPIFASWQRLPCSAPA